MGREDPGATITPMGRISIQHVATAARTVQSMDLPQKVALIDEIHLQQPNLLASCVVQARLGADEPTVEFLLNILLVCHLAMKASGYQWPLITEAQQERELARMVAAVGFSEDLADPESADLARTQYVAAHPEQPLLAFVTQQSNEWLRHLARTNAEKESDKFVLMAATNLVGCIAHADAQHGRAL